MRQSRRNDVNDALQTSSKGTSYYDAIACCITLRVPKCPFACGPCVLTIAPCEVVLH
jgi:hypothetical protein